MEIARETPTAIAAGIAAVAIGAACALAMPVQAQAATPAKAKITKVKTTGATVTVYAKAKKAEFYQYRLSTSKKFAKHVRKASTASKHYKFKGLKKNKRYYVKVRAVADKTGKWSKVKSVKTKKPARHVSGNVIKTEYGTISGFKLKVVKYDGTKYGRLSYKWKNTTKAESSPFDIEVSIRAYQSGIRLSIGDDSDSMDYDVLPGKTLNVYQDFQLRSNGAPVQVIIKRDYPEKTLYNHKFSI